MDDKIKRANLHGITSGNHQVTGTIDIFRLAPPLCEPLSMSVCVSVCNKNVRFSVPPSLCISPTPQGGWDTWTLGHQDIEIPVHFDLTLGHQDTGVAGQWDTGTWVGCMCGEYVQQGNMTRIIDVAKRFFSGGQHAASIYGFVRPFRL